MECGGHVGERRSLAEDQPGPSPVLGVCIQQTVFAEARRDWEQSCHEGFPVSRRGQQGQGGAVATACGTPQLSSAAP